MCIKSGGYVMNYSLENENLVIFLEGELNSYNSEEVEKEIDSIIKKNKYKAIVLDLEKLNYISSAGLRIIVRLRQQCSEISVRKPTKSVSDIFKMVGFENLIKIEK